MTVTGASRPSSSAFELLREKGGDGGDAPEHRDAPGPDTEAEDAIACATCDAVVSAERLVFSVEGGDAVGIFPNPYGQLKEIVTVKDAWGLESIGPGTTDFTWFAGYEWQVAYCASCRTHLGWRYDADGAAISRFYGLLLVAIRRL